MIFDNLQLHHIEMVHAFFSYYYDRHTGTQKRIPIQYITVYEQTFLLTQFNINKLQ